MKTSITSRFILIGSLSILLALLFDYQGFAIEPNTWRTIPGPVPRLGHTTTLLDDGRVLIVGGMRDNAECFGDSGPYGGPEDSIEVFDPATEQFTQIGSLIHSRPTSAWPPHVSIRHTTTLLRDGRVLIVGGGVLPMGGGFLPTEIFDPRTGQTQTDGRAPGIYGAHTATRLDDGRVLFTGGAVAGDSWSGCDYAAIPEAVIYDPVADQWTATGTPMAASRRGHTAIPLPNGDVRIMGGYNNYGSIWCTGDSAESANSVEVYETAQDRFVMQVVLPYTMSHLPLAISDSVLLADGRVLLLESYSTGGSRLYDPLTETLTAVPGGAGGYYGRMVGLQDGRAVAVDGLTNADNTWLYNLSTESWEQQTISLYGTQLHELTLLQDGRVLLTGGVFRGGPYTPTYYCYSQVAALYYPASILPTADASATRPLWVSPIEANATVELDGSRSSDENGDPLTYEWLQDSIPIATGMIAAVSLPVGLHEIDLVVNDGLAQDTNTVTVTVLTAEQAVQRLIVMVNESDLRHKRPLLASIQRGNHNPAANQLHAFQNKVSAQVDDPVLAMELIEGAGLVIDELDGSPKVAGRIHSLKRHANGKVQMQIKGAAGKGYVLEASTNLVDWEAVGVVHPDKEGNCGYEDTMAGKHQSRFYRLSKP